MDVFLMIRRKKTTIFLDAKENTMVSELKRMVEGITKQSAASMKLYKDNAVSNTNIAHMAHMLSHAQDNDQFRVN